MSLFFFSSKFPALTCDLLRMCAQDVHEVTHGIHFPPELAELHELWIGEQELLSIRVEPSQSWRNNSTFTTLVQVDFALSLFDLRQ